MGLKNGGRLRRLLIGGAAVVAMSTATVALSAPAHANDGYLYAWQFDNRGGKVCMWFNSDRDWSSCGTFGETTGTNMRNTASSLHNNGNTHKVRLFYTTPSGSTERSAWACMHVGTMWMDLDAQFQRNGGGPRFNYGGGKLGYQKLIVNDIAGHSWNTSCG